MSTYSSDPRVEPAQIRTYQQVRRAVRRGVPIPDDGDPILYADFFRGGPRVHRNGRAR